MQYGVSEMKQTGGHVLQDLIYCYSILFYVQGYRTKKMLQLLLLQVSFKISYVLALRSFCQAFTDNLERRGCFNSQFSVKNWKSRLKHHVESISTFTSLKTMRQTQVLHQKLQHSFTSRNKKEDLHFFHELTRIGCPFSLKCNIKKYLVLVIIYMYNPITFSVIYLK